ncbi:hypothetical protein ACP4OV_013434 [Aristida adscensionis]
MVMVLMEKTLTSTATPVRAAAVDRLSDLPDCVLQEHVLSRLTSLQAMRTSVLSRRWRHLWRDVPCVDIDQAEFLTAQESDAHHVLPDDDDDYYYSDEERACREATEWNRRTDWSRLADVADLATTMHAPSTPLDTFRLHITRDGFKLAHRWMRRGLARRPAAFHLRCDVHDPFAREYWPVFSLLSDAGAASTRRLRRLHLAGVALDDEFAAAIAADLPVLEDLRLEGCEYEFHRLASRSLKHLAIDDCGCGYKVHALALATPRMASLRIRGLDTAVTVEDRMPSIVAVSLRRPKPAGAVDLGDLLRSVRAARSLDLAGFSTAALLDDDEDDVVGGRYFPVFRNLRTLALEDCDVGVECQVLRCFLRNAPELETLALRQCWFLGGSRRSRKRKRSTKTTSDRRRAAAYECKKLKTVELEFYQDQALPELNDALKDISREMVHPIESSVLHGKRNVKISYA